MRPKWHFILKAALALAGIAILILALLYLASFFLFVLRQTGLLFMPEFGWRGFGVFFVSLPWLIILAVIIFISLLEILVRKYSFAYSKPLVYSLIIIVAFVFIGGLVVSRTGLHQSIFCYAKRQKLPFDSLYNGYGPQHFKEIHTGIISEITDSGFSLSSNRGETVRVVLSPETRLPAGAGFQAGDLMVVFGDRDDGLVKAFGARRAEEVLPENIPLLHPCWEQEAIPFGR